MMMVFILGSFGKVNGGGLEGGIRCEVENQETGKESISNTPIMLIVRSQFILRINNIAGIYRFHIDI